MFLLLKTFTFFLRKTKYEKMQKIMHVAFTMWKFDVLIFECKARDIRVQRSFWYPSVLLPEHINVSFCSSLFLMSSKLPLENGFQKATSQNLPSIEPSSVAHFFQNSSDFVSAEFRGRKMERYVSIYIYACLACNLCDFHQDCSRLRLCGLTRHWLMW